MIPSSPPQQLKQRPSKTYNKNSPRFCQAKDCTTKLSMYNPNSYCSIHEKEFVPLSKFF